jgi:flagellin
MPTVINTNLASLYAQNNLSTAQTSLAGSVQKLSSGLRINSAKDDAAGLAISQAMQTQINGVNQSRRNLNDATNLIQVADTSLGTIHDMLLRIKTLTTQGYDGSLSSSQRTQIVDEINELNTEINATAARTKFNRNNLIAATASASLSSTAMTLINGGTTATASISNVSANTSLFGTFTMTAVGADVVMAGIINQTYSAATTSATYSQTLTMSKGDLFANGSRTINFDQLGIALDVELAKTETTSVDFSTKLDSTLSITVAGLTLTATGSLTAAEVAAGFANLSAGTTSGNAVVGAGGTGAWSGTLTGWSTGSLSTTTVTFTSTASYSNVSAISITGAAGGSGATAVATATNGLNPENFAATSVALALSGKTITISSNSPADLVFQGGADTSTPNMVTYDAINVRTDTSQGGLAAMNRLGGQISVLNSYTTATAQTAWATAFSTLGSYVDAAVDVISEQRSVMGALQNRISYINQNLEAYSTNLQGSRSAIMDTDFAAETAKLTRGQIMQQAATAMLAQANQMNNVVLSLLK